ncbi:hypothetical protein MKY59_30985 [Paenibacillus sp. FSL W8-0426]|uniref:hypothetical protein n=1 Tax=Paenibacillus sp. FSL W8-0426 TaxID=2921714 RepID=UPI0030DA5049
MKLLQWFVKMLLTVVLVSSLTLLTTGLIVQSYVKSLLASFNIEWEGSSLGLTSMFQGALGGSKTNEKKSEPESEPTDKPVGAEEEKVPEGAISVMGNEGDGSTKSEEKASQDASQGNPDSGQGNLNEKSDLGANSETGSETGANAGAGTAGTSNGTAGTTDASNGTEEGKASTETGAVVVSPDDITNKKDSLPQAEKEKIFSLLMNKLPQQEMQQISSAMEGGLTEEELREIEQVISKYLTSEEYDGLMEVLQAE